MCSRLFLAAGILVAFLAAQETSLDAQFARALQLHQAGDLHGAISAYQEILKHQPSSGLRSSGRTNWQKVQALIDRLLRQGDSAEAHLMFGTAEMMGRDYIRISRGL